MKLAKNTTVSFEAFLFGSILTVTQNDIFEMGLMSIIVLCFVFVFWYRLLGVVQTPEYVEPYGTRAPLFHLAFLLLLALTVWIGLTTVGGLLTGALLVIPVLTARPYAHSFAHLVFGATLVSIASVWIGICTSLMMDVPTSSAIVLTVIALFLLSETVHRVTR
jgi:zinc transport system permease protein